MKLIEFTTATCGACKMLAQVINQCDDLPEIEIVDCEVQPELAGEFGIFQVPTLVLLDDDNKEVKRHSGFMPKAQLESWVNA